MDAFLAMIAYFGFSFEPMGWTFCNGQLLSVSQNTALFSLLGVAYGGNGSSNFGLPDLRGRVVLGQGLSTALPNQNYILGNPTGNTETVTLTTAQMPIHSHLATLSNATTTIKAFSGTGTSTNPNSRTSVLSGSTVSLYSGTAPDTPLNVGGGVVAGTVTVANNGSSAPVSVMQPYCVMNACICTSGIYPSRQ
jgi:microcystin-dependent protein